MIEKQLTNEVHEISPWNRENPLALTCREAYKIIFAKRLNGVRISGPTDFFNGASNLPAIALRPRDIEPSWTVKTSERRPRFSFVIPTFNQPMFLAAVLKQISLLKAEKGDWEVIVVDDGSSKECLTNLKSYLCDDDLGYNLRYYFWPKPTPIFRAGEARNLGAAKSCGEILVFLDSDMLVPPQFLTEVESSLRRATLVQFVREHIHPKFSSVYTTYESVRPEQCYIEEKNYWKTFFDSDNWENLNFFWKYTCSYALAIRKSEFDLVRGFNPCFTTYGFEDTDLGYRLYRAEKRFELNKLKLFHLSLPVKESKWITQIKRQESLSKTAKIFFLSHLDPEIFEHFQFYMADSGVWWARLVYFFRQKIKLHIKPKNSPT